MKLLALSLDISQYLKRKIGMGLSILPYTMMCGFIGLLYFPMILFLRYHDLGDDTPFSELGISSGWLAVILPVTMFVGYLFGWLCNAMIARLFYGWNKAQVHQVFLQSEVPQYWYKEGGQAEADLSLLNSVQIWASKRKKGCVNLVLRVVVMCYGLFAFYLLLFHPFMKGYSYGQWGLLLWPGVLFAIGAALVGLLMWFLSLSMMVWSAVVVLELGLKAYWVCERMLCLIKWVMI
ncbi:MAG: hypothetical protein HRT35_09205, partial [Algicola sp.]|nr:hypothetical protein [Algicola sp.]